MRIALLILALSACYDNRTPLGPDGGAPASTSCFPNLDGELTRDEMPTFLDQSIDFLVSKDSIVSIDGPNLDFRDEQNGERKQPYFASSAGTTWFADEFPSDSIVVPLGLGGQSFGILQSQPQAIRLLGIASVEEGYTLLQYQDPIDLYRFPLQPGMEWSMQSAVLGTLQSVPYNGTDRYEVAVEGIGSVQLPHLRFTHSFRVRTLVTSDSGAAGVVVTRRQLNFISECVGEVARVVSQDNESQDDFTNAAELWRFSL